MTRSLTLLLLLLLPAAALAGDDPPPLEASGNLEALEGTTWFGLHRRGKSVGALELKVTQAGEGWSVRLHCAYTDAQKTAIELTEELALGPGLKLIRATLRQREGDETATAEVRPDGTVLLGTQRWKPPAPQRLRLVGIASRLLVVNGLLPVARKAVRYEVEVLDLPKRTVRRVSLQLRRHSVWRNDLEAVFGGGQGWTVRVRGKPTRIEELRHPDFPELAFHHAKDRAAARRDRPPLELPFAADAPRGVVLDCLRGLLKGDPDAVAATIDWEQLTKSIARGEQVAAFKKQFLARVAGVPSAVETSPEELERVAPRLRRRELAGGRIQVTVPGDRTRFVLAQRQGRWRIVDLR